MLHPARKLSGCAAQVEDPSYWPCFPSGHVLVVIAAPVLVVIAAPGLSVPFYAAVLEWPQHGMQ